MSRLIQSSRTSAIASSMSLGAISGNKLRSVLTLLGIVRRRCLDHRGHDRHLRASQTHMEKEMTRARRQTRSRSRSGPSTVSATRRRSSRRRSWPPVTLEEAQAIRDKVSIVDFVGHRAVGRRQGRPTTASTPTPTSRCAAVRPSTRRTTRSRWSSAATCRTWTWRASRRVAVIGHALAEVPVPVRRPDRQRPSASTAASSRSSACSRRRSRRSAAPTTTRCSCPAAPNADLRPRPTGRVPRSVNVTVHATNPELLDDAIEEVRQVIRRQRDVRPDEDDNFIGSPACARSRPSTSTPRA